MNTRIAIAGAGGRMGQALIEATLAAGDLALAGALEIAGSPAIGTDAGAHCGRATGVHVQSDVAAVVSACDVLIDFTRPAGTLGHLAACAQARVAAVVGTTGFDAAGKAEIARHATVRWHWVKGHETGDEHRHKALNDRADRLAVASGDGRLNVYALPGK